MLFFQVDDNIMKESSSDIEKKYLEKHENIFLFYPKRLFFKYKIYYFIQTISIQFLYYF